MSDDYIGNMSLNNYWTVAHAFKAISRNHLWASYHFDIAVAGGIVFG